MSLLYHKLPRPFFCDTVAAHKTMPDARGDGQLDQSDLVYNLRNLHEVRSAILPWPGAVVLRHGEPL